MGELVFIPETLSEALEIREKYSSLPLAGGTDLMVQHFAGLDNVPEFDESVMIITALEELKGIKENEDGSVTVGALTTPYELCLSPLIHPLIKEAASRMGAVSLRNTATIGGNIANASPKGDLPQPLILLDATVTLVSKNNERTILVDDFIRGAKKTALEKNEIIKEINIPKVNYSHIFYRKIGGRRANAISKLSISSLVYIENGVLLDFRASSGAAGDKVKRSKDVESILKGKKLSEAKNNKEAFLDAWNKVISPRAMAEWRRNTTRRLLSSFIDSLTE